MTEIDDLKPLLTVEDLEVSFPDAGGEQHAVRGVSFSVGAGEFVGLVGESGCGKSLTALSVLRLVPRPGRIRQGRIRFGGQDLLDLPEEEIRKVRGARIGMVFQEPMTSLNPVFTIGYQIGESLRLHHGMSRAEARAEAIRLLDRVAIAGSAKRVDDYPHQLSGGQRQRAMIAMALACDPDLLIADEPSTALDVTVQAQILELLAQLRSELGLAVLLITHDLGVVAETCDRAMVMYAGRIIEQGAVAELFGSPAHPYTRGLLRAVPRLGSPAPRGELPTIPGSVPELSALPSGCAFHPRCADVMPQCSETLPEAIEISTDHSASCLLHEPTTP